MDFNAIRPDGPTIAIEHQATGEQPVHVTPDGIQPADQNVTQPEKLSFIPPIRAIRVKSCGNDWVTDIDAILTTAQIRGLSLDSDGVHIYSKERDIHGAYDNVFVPYSNLEALVFYFSSTEEDTEA